MNEYLAIHLSRIHDRLNMTNLIIDEALSRKQVSIKLAHELSHLMTEITSDSHLKQDIKEAKIEAYRLVDKEGVTHGN